MIGDSLVAGTRPASSTRPRISTTDRQRDQPLPDERLVADTASEVDASLGAPSLSSSCPRSCADVAEAPRHPSVVRDGSRSERELDPLAQDPRRGQLGASVGNLVVAMLLYARMRFELSPTSFANRNASSISGWASPGRSVDMRADRERLRRLGADELDVDAVGDVDRATQERLRLLARARAATGTTRGDGARRRARRGRRAARASRPPPDRPASASSWRDCCISGKTRRAFAHPIPTVVAQPPRTPRSLDAPRARSRRPGPGPTTRGRARDGAARARRAGARARRRGVRPPGTSGCSRRRATGRSFGARPPSACSNAVRWSSGPVLAQLLEVLQRLQLVGRDSSAISSARSPARRSAHRATPACLSARSDLGSES